MPAFPETWSVAELPDLSIGTVYGDGPEAFGSVGSVTVTGQGSLVIVDGTENELRAFDARGDHLWTTGGTGEGPGEFRELAHVAAIQGDSVVAFDRRTATVSTFTSDGQFARMHRLLPSEGVQPVVDVGSFEDGGSVGLGRPSGGSTPVEEGRYQTRVSAIFYGPEGALLTSEGDWPRREYVYASAGGDRYMSYALPEGCATQMDARGQVAVVATQERFEVLIYGTSGGLAHVLRVLVPPAPLNLDRYAEAGLRGGTLPDCLPAMGRVFLDTGSRVWVEEYVPPYESRTPNWYVFDQSGNPLAEVAFPSELVPHHIDRDFVVGVTRDSLDVDFVERRRIVR